MEKAYRYRFYPTAEQEELLRRTMGCVRLVYNRALAARTEAWYEKQERVDYSVDIFDADELETRRRA
jgi:putative transposase